jgi:Tn3 transposase DDE domain
VDQGQNRCAIGVDAAACGSRKQNALAKTLREIDRLERTLFTLDWISDPALRRRASAGLNKGEARNALARAIFFHRLGEIRDRTLENQRYWASGLNLSVAAVILWNTVYLGRAVAKLHSRGEVVSDDLIAHIAPLRWEHIAFNGDYVWPTEPLQNGLLTPPQSTLGVPRRALA